MGIEGRARFETGLIFSSQGQMHKEGEVGGGVGVKPGKLIMRWFN